jgi:hypothetical protein
VYATGYSNGATFTYAVGAALASRIAKIAPQSGSPMVGFATQPDSAARGVAQDIIDIHGTQDTTCPANATDDSGVSSDGWFYKCACHFATTPAVCLVPTPSCPLCWTAGLAATARPRATSRALVWRRLPLRCHTGADGDNGIAKSVES